MKNLFNQIVQSYRAAQDAEYDLIQACNLRREESMVDASLITGEYHLTVHAKEAAARMWKQCGDSVVQSKIRAQWDTFTRQRDASLESIESPLQRVTLHVLTRKWVLDMAFGK